MTDYTNSLRPVQMLQVVQTEQKWMTICMQLLDIDVDDPSAADRLRTELARRFPRLREE